MSNRNLFIPMRTIIEQEVTRVMADLQLKFTKPILDLKNRRIYLEWTNNEAKRTFEEAQEFLHQLQQEERRREIVRWNKP